MDTPAVRVGWMTESATELNYEGELESWPATGNSAPSYTATTKINGAHPSHSPSVEVLLDNALLEIFGFRSTLHGWTLASRLSFTMA
jgi:hypothetical protein